MSFENKKPKRVFSAKISSSNERQRPFSGTSAVVFTRNELINTIYNQQQALHISQRATSAKNLSTKIALDVERSKKIVVKQSKKKEELQNEIMHLKKTINQLVQELQQQKGKTESLRKKSQKYSKLLTSEYENEAHWNSHTLNSHLIVGIKNQYDNLKEKCEELIQQNDRFKKNKAFTRQLEYVTYIAGLQYDNKTLVDKVKRLSSGSIEILTNNQSQKMATDYIISEIQSDNRKLFDKFSELKGKYKMCRDNLKDRDNKIAILQKLAIEKDNNYHALEKKQSNNKRQIGVIRQKLNKITRQYDILHEESTRKTQSLQAELQVAESNYKEKLSQMINQKNFKIQALERQSLYFQNMVKELRSTNTQLNYQVQNTKLNKQSDRAIISLLNMNYEEQNTRNRKELEASTERYEKQVLLFKNSNKGVYENGKRVPQKANKKYGEAAQKKRKVSRDQIQDIIQFLKLKLISKGTTVQKIISLLSNPSEKGQWQIQYMNMLQVKKILQSQLIGLSPQESCLLARYLIEDVNEDYIYCDDNNENSRQIIKSILRNLISDSEGIILNVKIEKQAEEAYNNYKDKIRATLTTVEPLGFVSKKRFLDVLRNIGVGCSPEAQEVLLSHLAKHSTTLTQLSYKETYQS